MVPMQERADPVSEQERWMAEEEGIEAARQLGRKPDQEAEDSIRAWRERDESSRDRSLNEEAIGQEQERIYQAQQEQQHYTAKVEAEIGAEQERLYAIEQLRAELQGAPPRRRLS